MTKAFLVTPSKCAIFTEPSAGSEAPFDTPMSYIPYIDFHSDFDYYGLLANGTTTVNHAALAGQAGNNTSPPNDVFGTPTPLTIVVQGQITFADDLIYQHDLGYLPKFMVATGNAMLVPGTPVQNFGDGRVRITTAYCTTTQLRVWSAAYSTADALPAASIGYQYMIFRDPAVGLTGDMALLEADNVVFGGGKFRLTENHLRQAAVTGDSPFAIAQTRALDIANGGFRSYPSSGSPIDYGAYSGGMGAPTIISVAV